MTPAEYEILLTKKDKKIAQLRETLDKFDALTDVLTEGYGAASCINPLTDMTNAITKIRGLLAKALSTK